MHNSLRPGPFLSTPTQGLEHVTVVKQETRVPSQQATFNHCVTPQALPATPPCHNRKAVSVYVFLISLTVDVCNVCYQLPQVITCGLVVFLNKVLTNHVVHRDGSRGCLLPN